MKILLLAIAIIFAAAQHDHSHHLDIKFIRGETRRIAWLKIEEILGTIENYTGALKMLEGKWTDAFGNYKPEDRDRLDKIWDENFAPKYWDTYDRIFMLSQVCLDIYKDLRCKVPDDLWNNKYDRRGIQFHEEFINEVRLAISEELHQIKAARKDL